MAQKKKRHKAYTGKDAARQRPPVVRVQAVKRSKPRQWYEDHKQVIKPVSKVVIVIAIIVVIIIGVIDLIIR